MELTKEMVNMVEQGDSKALATYTKGCLHVVPVSTARVDNNKIILVNYFMGKTLANIRENSNVSFACWIGLEGYQIKANVAYITEGELFDSVTQWVGDILPERVVKGVLELTPYEVYDVSATATHPGERVL